MRVTHIITRLVIGGAQENTVATVLGLRKKSGVEVNLISGPTIGPGRLARTGSQKNSRKLLTIVPELVRPVHPLKDFLALRQLEKILPPTKAAHRPHAQRQSGNSRTPRRQTRGRSRHHSSHSRPVVRKFQNATCAILFSPPPKVTPQKSPLISFVRAKP